MKSLFLITFALLAAVASISAFAPNYSRQTITSSTTQMCMARRKPAKSQEEDVELTRAIIMKHIGSVDDDVVDDDDDDEEVEDVATNSSDEAGSESKGNKSIADKLKDKGRKIKNKLKSKIQKK
jgi:hypothetical protein